MGTTDWLGALPGPPTRPTLVHLHLHVGWNETRPGAWSSAARRGERGKPPGGQGRDTISLAYPGQEHLQAGWNTHRPSPWSSAARRGERGESPGGQGRDTISRAYPGQEHLQAATGTTNGPLEHPPAPGPKSPPANRPQSRPHTPTTSGGHLHTPGAPLGPVYPPLSTPLAGVKGLGTPAAGTARPWGYSALRKFPPASGDILHLENFPPPLGIC